MRLSVVMVWCGNVFRTAARLAVRSAIMNWAASVRRFLLTAMRSTTQAHNLVAVNLKSLEDMADPSFHS